MSTSRITRSQTRSLADQSSTLTLSSAPDPNSPSSSLEVERFFDCTTPPLTPSQSPSPPPLSMDPNPRGAPPHQAGAPPPIGAPPPPAGNQPPPAADNAPQAITAWAHAMTALMAQPGRSATCSGSSACPRACTSRSHQNPRPRSLQRIRSHQTARLFIAVQVSLSSSPSDFHNDQVKITYAVSWLKGTAQHWYEPNLALDEVDLPDYALIWDDFEEVLKTTFGEPDPVSSASYMLDNLLMKDSHHITKYNVEFNELSIITGYGERAFIRHLLSRPCCSNQGCSRHQWQIHHT